MKLLIVLLTGLVTVLAATSTHAQIQNQWQPNDMEANWNKCRWINKEYRCQYRNCIISFDGKQRCTTRIGPPTAEIYAQLSNRSYQCRWLNGKLICTYKNCRYSPDGKENCTSREGPPPADIDQERFAYHTTKTNCGWKSGKPICTKERCTLYPNGRKSCSTTNV